MRSDKVAMIALGTLAAGLVVVGLGKVGGPEEARRQNRDDARIKAATELAHCLAAGQVEGDPPLPAEMTKDTRCADTMLWYDPATNQPFRVATGEGKAISVCAVFENPETVRRRTYGAKFDPATGCVTAQRE